MFSYFLSVFLIRYDMVKSFRARGAANELKFSCANAVRANKVKFFIISALVLLAIAVGVFVAVKSHKNYTLYNLREINLDNFYSGVVASSSAFLSRCLSLLVNVVLICLLSLSSYLFPLACALFVFRAYLFGLNFALIFVFYGIGSLFTAVIIILPCQLLTLFALIFFYLILERMNFGCKKYGGAEVNRLTIVICALVVLLVLNLVETLLLFILSGKVILVI